MMAWMTPVSLHFSDVPTGWNNLYRQTTVGYWFCMFVTNSLSRRTVLQINLRQLHSVPCATRYASLPAPTSCFQAKVGTMMLQMWHVCPFYYCSNPATAVDLYLGTSTDTTLVPASLWTQQDLPASQQDAHTRDSQRSRCSARKCNISRLPLSSKHVLCFSLFFWYISYDDDESVVLSRSWPLPSQQRLAEMSSYRLTRLDRRVLGWHRSKYRWWCLPPSNDTFSSKQLANQLLPDIVRFLVANNILEPIQSFQAQMKECVVEFVHQRHPPLQGFPPHSLPWQNTLKSPNTLCDMFVHQNFVCF